MRIEFGSAFLCVTLLGCSYEFSDVTPYTETEDTETFVDSQPLTDETEDASETSETESQSEQETATQTPTVDSGSEDTGSEDTGSVSATQTETVSESVPPDTDLTELFFHFWERINSLDKYHGHELHIGPSTSTNPSDSGWTVLADADTMYNPIANGVWARGIPVELTAFSGQTIRLGLRYTGHFADDWYVDDLCVSTKASNPSEADCVFWGDFDDTEFGVWPEGFLSVEGLDNNPDSKDWQSTSVTRHSSPHAAGISYSYMYFPDRFLVTAPITLP